MNDRRATAPAALPPAAPPSNRRHDALLAVAAASLALWFGLAAPSASPVGPPAPASAEPVVADQAADPLAQVAPVVPASPSGTDRRGDQLHGRTVQAQRGRGR